LKALVRDNGIETPRNEKEISVQKGESAELRIGETQKRNSNRIGTQVGRGDWIENVGKSEKLRRGMRQRVKEEARKLDEGSEPR